MNLKIQNLKFKMFFLAMISGSLFSSIAQASAATYYVDYATGSDNNNGTSKATPWQHAPGMQGCLITDTNNNPCRARSHSSASGDSIILKGGVTWPAAALGWDWYFGNSTYFGVDQTWYTGASWTRPILDNEGLETTASPEGTHWMMRAYGTDQVVDNIEFTGMAQLHGGDNGYIAACLQIGTNAGTAYGGEINNCYFHGWSHGPVSNGLWMSGVDAGGTAGDNSHIIQLGSIDEPDPNLKIHHNVIDGSDTTRDMAMAIAGIYGNAYNNYIAYLPNAIFGGSYIWGNTITEIGTTLSFCPSIHYNVIEENRGQSIFYNNLILNTHGGDILTYSVDGKKDYIFNNVIIGDNGASLQLGTSNGGQITLVTGVGFEQHTFNNTIQSIEGNNFYPISGPTLTGAALMPLMEVRNNHLVGQNHTVNFGEGVEESGKIESNTLGITNPDAIATNYLLGGYYAPPAGGATIGAGYNLNAFCSTLPISTYSDPAAACLSDTTRGVLYDSVNHTIIGDGKVAVLRGSTWDIGAYEYATEEGDATPPTAPSGLAVE